MGPRVWRGGPWKVTGGSDGPGHFPTLNEQWCPDRPGWQPGGTVILELWLGGLQSPELWCQVPGAGPSRTTKVRVANRRLAGLS